MDINEAIDVIRKCKEHLGGPLVAELGEVENWLLELTYDNKKPE